MRYTITAADKAYAKGVSRYGHISDGAGNIVVSEKEVSTFGIDAGKWYSTREIKEIIAKGNWK